MRINRILSQNLLIFMVLLLFTNCNRKPTQIQHFVSTGKLHDTLIFYSSPKEERIKTKIDGTYERTSNLGGKVSTDKGEWWYDSRNNLILTNWINRGETFFYKDEPTVVAFKYRKATFRGGIKRIYYDVDNYYYYKRIYPSNPSAENPAEKSK